MADEANRLYVPRPVGLLRFRARTTTGTAPNGERAKVVIDDSGTVFHFERNDGMDATVRPNNIRLTRRVGDPFVRHLLEQAKGRPNEPR